MPNLQVMHVSHELYILHYLFFLSMPYRMSVISYIFFLSWMVYVLDAWSIPIYSLRFTFFLDNTILLTTS
jgi:hypothetical protein